MFSFSVVDKWRPNVQYVDTYDDETLKGIVKTVMCVVFLCYGRLVDIANNITEKYFSLNTVDAQVNIVDAIIMPTINIYPRPTKSNFYSQQAVEKPINLTSRSG